VVDALILMIDEMIDENENEIIYFNKFETWHSMVTVVKAVGGVIVGW